MGAIEPLQVTRALEPCKLPDLEARLMLPERLLSSLARAAEIGRLLWRHPRRVWDDCLAIPDRVLLAPCRISVQFAGLIPPRKKFKAKLACLLTNSRLVCQVWMLTLGAEMSVRMMLRSRHTCHPVSWTRFCLSLASSLGRLHACSCQQLDHPKELQASLQGLHAGLQFQHSFKHLKP